MPAPSKLAVIGAGMMAQRRVEAFLQTGRVEIGAFVSRRVDRAKEMGTRYHCPHAFDNVAELDNLPIDAILIEVPHDVQSNYVRWAANRSLPILIGGPLASSLKEGQELVALSQEKRVLIETGYEARYKEVWLDAKAIIQSGEIGTPIAVNSIALWPGNPESWYYSQVRSGGMPLTHMSYAFINPLRWLFGNPQTVSACANRRLNSAAGAVLEETCVASLTFPGDVLASMMAGYVAPPTLEAWGVTVLGTQGAIEIHPSELSQGYLVLHRRGEAVRKDYADSEDAFVRQAHAFLDAMQGGPAARNPAEDSLVDLDVADAIHTSCQTGETIRLTG